MNFDYGSFQVLSRFSVSFDYSVAFFGGFLGFLGVGFLLFLFDEFGELGAEHIINCDINIVTLLAQQLVSDPSARDS